MYNWELNNYFQSVGYKFSNFYDFECIRGSSPQVRFNLNYEDDYETCLNVFTDVVDYHWLIHILKQNKSY